MLFDTDELLLDADELLPEDLLLDADELLFCWEEDDELRVAVALFFCCELEEDDLTADVLFEEDEDELLDAELELFEDEDELLLLVAVAFEPPPLRVCAAAGTEHTSAPARRAASVSLNSFIIFDFAVPR